ncbi:MAG TPA: condensation domain-containing protein, partial [Pyrinomonadaceae bacterium]|nr:condensation domain-containing protein [Pyrinomonadaceae bacterium]
MDTKSINSPEVESTFPMTAMQRGMLVHSIDEKGAYIQQIVGELTEPIDVRRFLSSWRHVIAKYPVLRTAFRWDKATEPYQAVF